MAWDTGASSKTKFLSSLRYLVSLLAVVSFYISYVCQNENLRVRSPATLDSAVTLGHYGAKNFLLRDKKDVVQCIFYENVSLAGQFGFL